MGRDEESEDQYKLALKADPKHALAHYNYGTLLKKWDVMKKPKSSMKLALEETHTNNANAHCKLRSFSGGYGT